MNRRHLLLSLTLLPLPALAAPGDLRIAPARGIGKVRLGMTRVQVHADLGRPRETNRWGGGIIEERWSRKPKNDGDFPPYVSVLYQQDRVVQVEVSSRDFSTAGGVSTKSTFKEIRAAYPKLRVTEYLYEDARGLYYDDRDEGIAFYVGGQDYIRPEYSPEAIIVHRPGFSVIPHPGGKKMKVETDRTAP